MSDVIEVKCRDTSGSKRIRRLRATGVVPGVVYGHGQETQSVVMSRDQIFATIRQGHRLVELKGDLQDKAFIREVQWNTFGSEVLHVDFFRVSEKDKLRTVLPIELRGEAAGIREGGVVEFVLHEVEIECPVASLPDKLLLNVSDLKLRGAIHASEIPLPAGAKLLSDGGVVVVHCISPKGEEELLAATATAAEPELIRKEKPADEDAE